MSARSKTILLVDNERPVLDLLTLILETDNHRCHQACNGAEALEIFRQQHFDVVITDFKMPVMDGFEFVRAIRALRPEIKVILSSGSLGNSEQTVARELGVDALLPKPWSAAEVLARVRWLFRNEGG
jgi:DNA-binding response OmpR family regulator